MAINRVLYATQTARLGTSANWYSLPAQSANADETIPQDDVLVLGKLGGVARLQKDVATSKASVKFYLCDTITVDTSAAAFNAFEGTLRDADLQYLYDLLADLETDSIAGTANTLNVDSTGTGTAGTSDEDGFSMAGVCSSIGIDASKGAFPMVDLSFEGVGRLNSLAMGTTGTLTDAHGGDWHISSCVPITSADVSITGVTTDTIANVKIAYDMPTETLSKLGGVIAGTHNNVSADNQMFSKPPFKASMTADGQSAAQVATAWAGSTDTSCQVKFNGTAHFMKAAIQGAGLNVSTKSFSQNVGDVGATFSVTAEGTKMLFTNT